VAQARNRSGLALRALAIVALGCGGGGLGAALAQRFPDAAALPGQRLADANPYPLPHGDRLAFFHCRWPTGAAIPVSLPPDASPAERRSLEAALDAWADAGLGVRFEPVAEAPRGIELRLVGGTVDTPAGQDTTNTVVDCAIAPLSVQDGGDVAGAELVAARIHIARLTNEDMQGRQRPLTEAELTGTALHELGHALGFQGHARHGDTIMVREVERIQHAGRDLLRGRGFADASVRALYRLPSGAVLASVPVERCRTDPVDRMARLAEDARLAGPFVRVGEAAGRIYWRDAAGLEYGLVLGRLREALRDPSRLVVIPESRVRASLAQAKDVACAAR
jgi:hypothetical protein